MKIDLAKYNEYVERRLITRREHPNGGLLIWNYTPLAQYSKTWDDVTLQARGLITDLDGNIVARPFSKFFNYGEYSGTLPDEPFTVHEKLDGSLGIMYFKDHEYSLATRGSFESDQAKKGTQMLRQYMRANGDDWIDPYYTYLFEIIYPSNRIVVDYGRAERLVLLAAIHTETGREIFIDAIDYPDKAPRLYTANNIEDIKVIPARENAEGVVIRFEGGLRLKLKFDEYVRLHRLLTNVSSKNIWEYLKTGQPLDELLERVPDEFYQWVRETRDTLQIDHDNAIATATAVYDQVKDLPDRKSIAMAMTARSGTTKSIVWALLDGKTDLVHEIAWKAAKPTYERPFKEDIDA